MSLKKLCQTSPTFSENKEFSILNTYVIKRVKEPVDFNTVSGIRLENRYLATPADTEVFAKVAYSESAIHVWLRTVESSHRCEEHGPLGEPYHDSCLEFFFAPDANRPERYFNFEFNSNKCLYLGIRTSKENTARLLIDPDESLSPKVQFNSDGWEISFSIPYDFIRIFSPDFSPKRGDKLPANCFKCADRQDPAEYLSWCFVPPENLNFHKPECFGTMIFE